MAYYRRRYTQKKSTYKPPSARKTNIPISRTLKKRPRPRSKPARNTTAIMQLSRQVKSLQLARSGYYQKANHFLQIGGADLAPMTPLIFTLNDFTLAGTVSKASINGVGTPIISNYTGWTHVTDPLMGANTNNIKPQHSYWANVQDDHVSREAYRPISATINIDIEDTDGKFSEHHLWIRVDVVKQTKILPTTTVHNLNLPWNAYALGNMAVAGPFRNRYNKEYFKIIQTKWICVKNDVEVVGNNPATYQTGRCRFKVNFPNKILQLDAETKLQPSSAGVDGTPITQLFDTNVEQTDKYFVVINASRAAGSNCNMTIRRFISWRDKGGVAA